MRTHERVQLTPTGCIPRLAGTIWRSRAGRANSLSENCPMHDATEKYWTTAGHNPPCTEAATTVWRRYP